MKKIYAFSKGFSLTEIMVVLTLFILLASVGMGAYFQYYQFSLINNEITSVEHLLKNTRFKSLKNPINTAYGIYLDTSNQQIISFKTHYSPTEISNVVLPLEHLNITNLNLQPIVGVTNEILFAASTAKTENTGSFTISNNEFSYIFNVNAEGAIE